MKEAIVITVIVLKTSLEAFEARLAAVLKAKKASRLLACSVEHVEDYEETWQGREYHPATSKFAVSLSWEAAIPGHTLVAHRDLSNGMVTAFGGKLSREEYKRMDGGCELCGYDRDRRHQFLVEETATGKRQVVGGSCARKFCGVDLEAVVARMNRAAEVIKSEAEESMDFGCRSPHQLPFSVRMVLAAAELTIQEIGWTPRRLATDYHMATADIVCAWCCDALQSRNLTQGQRDAVDRLRARMEKVDLDDYRAFVAEELARRWSDLAQSWANALEEGQIDGYGFGRLSYLVVARGKAEAAKRDKSNGARKAYQPEAGLGKMHDLPGEWTVVAMKEGETQYGYYIGVTAKSADGATVWFKSTTKTKDLEIGGTYRLRGKIKDVKDTISFLSHASVKN